MRWPIFIILVIALVLLSVSVAASTVQLAVIDNEIVSSEEALFQATLTNDQGIPLSYTLYGLDVVWSITPEARKFTLMPGKSRTVEIKVRPLGPFKPSAYVVKLYIDESISINAVARSRYEQELPIVLYPDEPLEYLPALGLHIDMPAEIDPQQQIPVAVQLINRNPLNLTSLGIRIQSEMPEFNQEQTLSLSPREEKKVEFAVTPNKHQPPRDYTLFFVLERAGQPIKVVEKKVSILPVTVPFAVIKTESASWLRTVTRLEVSNEGNVPDTQEVRVPVSFWSSLFTSGEAQVRQDEGTRNLIWERTLDPAESITLQYATNYRIPFLLLTLAILFGLFYLYARSPVELRKSALTTKSGEDGTLSEVKLTLEIRNLSGRAMKEITITDLIPSIANLEKGLDVGTMKPTEVKHTQQGTKVIWSMAELDAREHRIITYKIKAKLSILGTFSLPRASMEYRTTRGRKRKAYSNIFRLG